MLRPRGIVLGLSWLCLLVLVTAWAVMHFTGDRWWFGTLLIFGPRWVWGIPVVALLPAVLWLRPKAALVLALCAVVVVGPIMGMNVPWRRVTSRAPVGQNVRILSCNVQYGSLNAPAMAKLIAETQPDIVALQEWDARRPAALFVEGWHVHNDRGELLLAGRYPIRKMPQIGIPAPGAATCYRVEMRPRPVYVIDVHLASPHTAFDSALAGSSDSWRKVRQNTDIRREQSRIIQEYVRKLDGPVLLAGDFNSPPDGAVYREHWSGFTNAFASASFGFGYTYIKGRHCQVRIDHILGSPGWRAKRCRVGPDVGSLHRPVVAEMVWNGNDR